MKVARVCQLAHEGTASILVRCDADKIDGYRQSALETLVKSETLMEVVNLDYDDMFENGQLVKEEDDE